MNARHFPILCRAAFSGFQMHEKRKLVQQVIMLLPK
jgi:hypothetical protein